MAFTAQKISIVLGPYLGAPVTVPTELNPSAYDVVELEVELATGPAPPPASNPDDVAICRISLGRTSWDCISGISGSVFAAGASVFGNGGVAALVPGNHGTITPGGDFVAGLQAVEGGLGAYAVFHVTLARASGGQQGER